MAERGLPFGRPSSQPPSTQFHDERKRSLPGQDGWTLSALENVQYGTLAASTVSANTVRFIRLPHLTEDFKLIKAAARITATAAAGTLYGGIYMYTTVNSQPTFLLVPGTKVAFDTSAVARLETPLSQKVRLYAGEQYFISGNCTSAVPTLLTAFAASLILETTRILADSGMPAIVPLSATTKTYDTARCPLVLYMSEMAMRVL